MAFLLGLWILWLAVPAHAGLELCNDTVAPQSVAVGYKQDGDWVSEGWWELKPGACVTSVAGELKYRFYYFRAESPGWEFRHDRLSFCTSDVLFTVRGDGECEERGYEKSYFAKIDTGKDAQHFKQTIAGHLRQSSNRQDENFEARSGTWGIPYAGDVNFHACSRLFGQRKQVCSFVGNGRVFNVTDDGRTDPAVFASLSELALGAPVHLEGDWAARFENSVELVLYRLTPRSETSNDRLLMNLAGAWSSVADARDQFRVVGSSRRNSYDGFETLVEYISVMNYCGENQEEGPYLYAWDSQGGTGLCYVIRALTDRDLVLIYLPRGTELRYQRIQ